MTDKANATTFSFLMEKSSSVARIAVGRAELGPLGFDEACCENVL